MEETTTPEPIAAPRGIGGLGKLGLILAAPFYLFALLHVMTFQRSGPEDGMAVGFVMIGEIPLWIGIALFLASVAKRARLSTGVAIAAWLLLPAAAYASFQTFEIMDLTPGWLAIVPLLAPALFVWFGLWAVRQEAAIDWGRPVLAFAAALLALLALFVVAQLRHDARMAANDRQAEAELARYEAEFQQHLRTETRLDGLLPNLGEEADRQVRALAAIRRLPSRQADAVRLLDAGRSLLDLAQLHDFGLEATAPLCAAYRGQFDRLVANLGRADDAQPVYVEQQSANIAWLTANGCDLSASLRAAAARLRENEGGLDAALANSLEEMAGRNGAGTQ